MEYYNFPDNTLHKAIHKVSSEGVLVPEPEVHKTTRGGNTHPSPVSQLSSLSKYFEGSSWRQTLKDFPSQFLFLIGVPIVEAPALHLHLICVRGFQSFLFIVYIPSWQQGH